jgi:hypothetical protein
VLCLVAPLAQPVGQRGGQLIVNQEPHSFRCLPAPDG